jgi:hypothetical protein
MANYSRETGIAGLVLQVAGSELKTILDALARLIGEAQTATEIKVDYSGRSQTVTYDEFFERRASLPNRIYEFTIKIVDCPPGTSIQTKTLELEVTPSSRTSLTAIALVPVAARS